MNPISNLPTGWAALFWGVITFSLLIFLHEGGHFLAARVFGVRVHEFMLGLPGPGLKYRSKRSGTSYGVTVIPLGGYCRIAGMEPGPEDQRLADALGELIAVGSLSAGTLSVALDIPVSRAVSLLRTLADYGAAEVLPDEETYSALVGREADESAAEALARVRRSTYRGLPTWKRIAVLAMGVLVNLVAAILILTGALALIGVPTPTLTIAAVSAGGPAATAGVRPGDTVLALGGAQIADWTTLKSTMDAASPGAALDMTVRRDGSVLHLSVTPTAAPSGAGALLGITAGTRDVPVPAGKAFGEALNITGQVGVAIVAFLNPATFSKSLSQASSVVGASYEVARAAETGAVSYALMVALLSLSLAFMNLVPIPPLDGGKIVMEIVEVIIRRPVPRKLSITLSAIGTLLLFSLVFYLMYSDVLKYILVKG